MIKKFFPDLKIEHISGFGDVVPVEKLDALLRKKMVFSTIEGDHIVQKIELSHIVRMPSVKEAEVHEFLRNLNTPESILLARKIEIGGMENGF